MSEAHNHGEPGSTARKVEAPGSSTPVMRDHILVGDVAPISGRVAAADATPILCLATHVLANDARHPVMVADDAATPGVLPDGRLELGMGAGRLALDDAAGSAEALIWNIGRVC